jgi:polysaccharide biosynthesis protein PslH
MKILQICKKYPFPLRDGESIAVTYLSRALVAAGCEVTLLTMNTSKHWYDAAERPADFKHYKEIYSVDVYNHVHVWGAFLNLFSKDSFHASRFRSEAFEQKLVELLQAEDYDIVQIETIIPALFIPIIRAYSKAKVVIRPHNVEHEIWARLADGFMKINPLHWYFRLTAHKLRQFEVNHLTLGDMIVPITRRDEDSFRQMGYNGLAHLAPIGLNSEDYQVRPIKSDKIKSLCFIGSLDWAPNQQGLRWFLQDIWPDVKRHYPHLSLHVAGSNSPSWLQGFLREHVVLEGQVENAHTFISEHPIMIVPLLSGSGMRVKILEAMFLGRVVISTTVGLEGIPARDGIEVLVADTTDAFMRHVQALLQDPDKAKRISTKARAFVTDNFDNLRLGQALRRSYQHLLTFDVNQHQNN